MATPKELLTAAYDGETPEQTPFSMYDWFMLDPRYPPAEFEPLLEMGLGLVQTISTVDVIQHGVTRSERVEARGRHIYHYRTIETPVGDLHSLAATPADPNEGLQEWTKEPWVKTPADYRIMQWIAAHSECVPAYDRYAEAVEKMGEQGIITLGGLRTPAQRINIDYAGTEQFCIDIALEVTELLDLYEAERKLFMDYHRLVAQGPGRWVKWNENLTIEMLGPGRYERFLLNIYDEVVPMLEASGKRTYVHYDGNLRVIKDLIARAPFHMIESLTEPPEGDMLYDECRAAWPDKAFAGNINVRLYDLPDDQFRQIIIEKRERAGKKGFSFEISEEVPDNWRTKIPVVLETLAELG